MASPLPVPGTSRRFRALGAEIVMAFDECAAVMRRLMFKKEYGTHRSHGRSVRDKALIFYKPMVLIPDEPMVRQT